MKKNALVAQSGGPTAVINATLAGILRECYSSGIDTLYGARNGLEGLLREEIFALKNLGDPELYLLAGTPAAALGSCRKKLADPLGADTEEYEKIFRIFKKFNIRYFFYIGGNDSMDAVEKLTVYLRRHGIEMVLMGVPKSIDNDMVQCDHTPGYGSAAKYVASTMQEIAMDCAVYTIPAVTIVEVMGRDAGWLTAAAALPRINGQAAADLIYLPELPFSPEKFLREVEELFKKKPNIVIAVSEGLKTADGQYAGAGMQSGARDAFGHAYLSGTAQALKVLVKAKFGCKTRAVELSLPQRCASHLLSKCDVEEAFSVGQAAVKAALREKSAGMITLIRRISNDPYEVEYVPVEAKGIANLVRPIPLSWIAENGRDVTDECIAYMAPLIRGEFPRAMENGLPAYFTF